eukprot:895700-Pelagomonas_calceolata.AAC.2
MYAQAQLSWATLAACPFLTAPPMFCPGDAAPVAGKGWCWCLRERGLQPGGAEAAVVTGTSSVYLIEIKYGTVKIGWAYEENHMKKVTIQKANLMAILYSEYRVRVRESEKHVMHKGMFRGQFQSLTVTHKATSSSISSNVTLE